MTRASGPNPRIQLRSAKSLETFSVSADAAVLLILHFLRRVPQPLAGRSARSAARTRSRSARGAPWWTPSECANAASSVLGRLEALLRDRQRLDAIERERPRSGRTRARTRPGTAALREDHAVRLDHVLLLAVARNRVIAHRSRAGAGAWRRAAARSPCLERAAAACVARVRLGLDHQRQPIEELAHAGRQRRRQLVERAPRRPAGTASPRGTRPASG